MTPSQQNKVLPCRFTSRRVKGKLVGRCRKGNSHLCATATYLLYDRDCSQRRRDAPPQRVQCNHIRLQPRSRAHSCPQTSIRPQKVAFWECWPHSDRTACVLPRQAFGLPQQYAPPSIILLITFMSGRTLSELFIFPTRLSDGTVVRSKPATCQH